MKPADLGGTTGIIYGPNHVDSDTSSKLQSVSENVFQRVRDLIVHGMLAPGSRVIEADLAKRLGVSRTPIRSALHRLRQEGYITLTSETGNKARLAVAPLTQDDASELYRIIACLEGLAARAAARLQIRDRELLVRELIKYNKGLEGLAGQQGANPSTIFDLDMNLHETIVVAGAGPRLRAIHAGIKPQTERYWRLYASAVTDQLSLSVNEHTQIIEGIKKGDPGDAERAVKLNWSKGAERLCQVIATLGERGSW